MKTFSLLCAGASALVLAACGAPEASETATAEPAGEAGAQTAQATASGPDNVRGQDNEELNMAARAACEAVSDGRNAEPPVEGDFLAAVPAESGFVYRGADAIVRAACTLDGQRESWVVPVAQLTLDQRTAFDFAMADFIRHNARRADDRLTSGFFTARDGGNCTIQQERAVIEPMCEAARLAAVQLEENAAARAQE